jgi:hypothetical protein
MRLVCLSPGALLGSSVGRLSLSPTGLRESQQPTNHLEVFFQSQLVSWLPETSKLQRDKGVERLRAIPTRLHKNSNTWIFTICLAFFHFSGVTKKHFSGSPRLPSKQYHYCLVLHLCIAEELKKQYCILKWTKQ